MGHLRVTIGHLRLNTGYHKATVVHIRVKLYHLRVTIGHLRVTIGYFFSELHPKVRQTCSYYSGLADSFRNINCDKKLKTFNHGGS